MKANNTRNIRSTKTAKISNRGRAKIKRAEVDYIKMWRETEPFIKKRNISQYSTAGKWKVLSHET